MENCIKRNEKTIHTEYNINGKKIEIEQRLITNSELDEYKKRSFDITQDPVIFDAILESQKETGDDNLTNETLRGIRKATMEINKLKAENDYWLIAASASKNPFYGGYFMIDDEQVEDVIEILRLLESDIIEKLMDNVEKLMTITKEEDSEGK